MTPEAFQAAAIAILRSAVGWQSAIARRLGVTPRTVRHWLHSGTVPDWVAKKFAEWIGAADIAPWPRDEWLIGDAVGGDGRRREYIYHMQPPRFVARIVACDLDGTPLPEEEPADILSGVVYAADEETLLCEIEWIDEVAPGEHSKWLEAAADVIEALADSYADD